MSTLTQSCIDSSADSVSEEDRTSWTQSRGGGGSSRASWGFFLLGASLCQAMCSVFATRRSTSAGCVEGDGSDGSEGRAKSVNGADDVRGLQMGRLLRSSYTTRTKCEISDAFVRYCATA